MKSTSIVLITPEIQEIYHKFQQDLEELIRNNSECLKTSQNSVQALFARGCAQKHLTRYQLAMEDFSKVIQINNTHAPSYYKRCLACLALGYYGQALNDADKYLELCRSQDQHIGYFNRGICYMKMSDLKKARADFTKALDLKPDQLLYSCYRARIATTKEDAKHQSNEIIKIISHPIHSDTSFIRAMTLQECRRSDEAFRYFEDAFQRNPINIEALFQIGIYHADLNEHDQAINIFNQSLTLLPNDSRTLQYRGMSYAALGEIDKARDDFDLALKMNPSTIIFLERGLLNFRLGSQQVQLSNKTESHTQLAIKDMSEVIKNNPNSSIAHLISALAYGQDNMIKKVLQELDDTLSYKFDSIFEEIEKEKKQLSQIKEMLSDLKHHPQQQNNLNSQLIKRQSRLEKELQQISDQCKMLNDVIKKLEPLGFQLEFYKRKDKRLYRFCKRLIVKTQCIFIGAMAIASGKVDAASGGGKLDKTATVISLLGKVLSLVPIFGSAPQQVTDTASLVLHKIDQQRQTNIAIRIANMLTMMEMWKVVEEMAIDLTEKYHSQILEIFDEPNEPQEEPQSQAVEEKKKCSTCCGPIKTIPYKMLAKEDSFMSEQVAEFGVGLLLDGLAAKRINDEDKISLSIQFIKCICTGEDLGLLSVFKDSKIRTISTEKKWTMYGFFQKVGIQVDEHNRYGGENVDTETYGFRQGTGQDVEEMQLKWITKTKNCNE